MRNQEKVDFMEAYASIYAPQELTEEVEIASEYFYNLGLNEEGVNIFIEELGVEDFGNFVYQLAEEYFLDEATKTRLQSGGALKGPKGSRPQSTTNKRIAKQGGTKMSSSASPSSTVSPKKVAAAAKIAKQNQPAKKGQLGAIADRVRQGMKDHNDAVAKTKETIGKAAKGVGHVVRQFGRGLSGTAKIAGHIASKGLGEEVEAWVNALVKEGYDLSEYTWDDMVEIYLEEVENLDEIMRHQQERDRIEARKAAEAKRVKKARSPYGKLSQYSPPTKGVHGEIERRQAQRPPSRLRSGSLPEEYIDEEPKGLPYGPVGKGFRTIPAGPQRNKMMEREKHYTQAAMRDRDEVYGGESVGSNRTKMGRISSALRNPRLREETDLFDYILEHLVAEGYADTNQAALSIMANMSEEWKQSIVEAAVRNRGFIDTGLDQNRTRLANAAIDASGRTVPTHPKGLRMIPTHHSAARLPSGELKTKSRNKAKKDAYYQNQRYGQGSI